MKHLTTLRLIDRVARIGSIRKAAEDMALTPSALHRRIQTFEEELGERIFDRLPNGVRPNAAGELVILHIRNQIAETDRLRSRLADLAGIRRGHVRIACSQALTPYFLPEQIAAYRRDYPDVTFEVLVLDHSAAEDALADYTADLALVFDSGKHIDVEVTTVVHQDLRAVVARDHPLAAKPVVRLRECLVWPLALPTTLFGGRRLLQRALARSSLHLQPAIESNSFEFLKRYVLKEQAVSFQIPVGVPHFDNDEGLVSLTLDPRDVPSGLLFFAQKRDRILPVASARFADQITRHLVDRFGVADYPTTHSAMTR